MIPRCYPSSLSGITRQMVVYPLASIVGLQRWVDYIPVITTETGSEGTTNSDGYVAMEVLTSITGKQAFVDYIPVYVDAAATDAFAVSATGGLRGRATTGSFAGGGGGGGGATDPYWSNVVLLLKGEGANDSTTFTDSSTSGMALTANGNVKISTSQFKYGASSIYFDGSGDYLGATSKTEFGFGTGDFTVECFLNPEALAADRAITDFRVGSGNDYATFFLNSAGQLSVWGGSLLGGSGSAVPNGVQTHVAISRTSGVLKGFIGGVEQWSGACTWEFSSTRNIGIGGGNFSGGAGTSPYKGYMDELRITKGVGRYTGTFTPPSETFPTTQTPDSLWSSVQLLLKGDGADGSTSIVDSSSAARTVTKQGTVVVKTTAPKFGTGSILFGNSYIDVPGLSFGTGDFTVEFHVRVENFAAAPTLMDNRGFSPAASLCIYNDGTAFRLYAADANIAITSNLAASTYYHMAVCRASGVTRFFLNGVQQGSNYADTNNYNQTSLRFAANYIGTSALNTGYMDEIRVTTAARYTANFTPPAAAFPTA